jgi:hypothetical protein
VSFSNSWRLVLLGSAVALVSAWGAPSSTRSPAGRLILRNASWDSVRVEVRVGRSGECDGLAALRVRTLLRDKAWSIDAADLVCGRRTLEPERPNDQWTAWRWRRVDAGAPVETTL